MIALIVYLIITTLIGLAMALAMVGNDVGIRSMAAFFNPKILRKDLLFRKRATVITLIIGYSLMPLWGVGYWIVKLIKYMIKRVKR